ncbi:MAG: hypothetical protein R3E10_10720 [Gemmatimonadota bacterium]
MQWRRFVYRTCAFWTLFGLGPVRAETSRDASADLLARVEPCDGPGAHPWLVETRDRLLAEDRLAGHAVQRFGPPLRCEGSIGMEEAGAVFGTVRLGFAEGASLELTTLPPESSILTLRAPQGLGADAEARSLLERYASERGLHVEWDSYEVTQEGDETLHTWWDPDPGLNASVSLLYSQKRLVGLRVSMAL